MDWDNCFVFSHVDLRLENSVVVHDDIVFIYLWAYDNIVLFLKFETHCLSTPAKQIQCYTTSVLEDFGEKETTCPLLVFEQQICCIVSIFFEILYLWIQNCPVPLSDSLVAPNNRMESEAVRERYPSGRCFLW